MSDIAQSILKIQSEAINVGNGRRPMSESLLFAIGGALNHCIPNVGVVGDIVKSMLDETQFQSLRDDTWVLADGRSVIGSQFQALTGLTNIPDFRATFTRMSNGPALGTYQGDQMFSHGHALSFTDPGHFHSQAQVYTAGTPNTFFGEIDEGTTNIGPYTGNTASATTGVTVGITNTGGGEFNPKCVVVNFFIKINP